jgi:uncharacterized protein with GYD domain
MPKYLLKARYSVDGVRGLMKDGGTRRVEVARQAVESVGGSLESFYFAFGDTDVYAVADLPDVQAATAVSLTIGASGAVGVETVVLLTPAEVDEATKRQAEYSPPGT